MAIDLITALVERSLRTLPCLPDGEEGLHHGDELAFGERIDDFGGGFQGCHGVRVAKADAGEHLAAVGSQRVQRGGRVAGEAVVELVDQAGEPAAVHRAEEQLAVQCPEQEQVVHDVGGCEDAVDVRVGEGDLQPVQELAAVRHRHRVVADGEGAAGRVVGGDDEVLRAGLDAGVAAARFRGAGDGGGVLEPDGAQVFVAAGIIVHRGGGGGGIEAHRVAPSGA